MKNIKEWSQQELLDFVYVFVRQQSDKTIFHLIKDSLDFIQYLYKDKIRSEENKSIDQVLQGVVRLIQFGVQDPCIVIAAVLRSSVRGFEEKIVKEFVSKKLWSSNKQEDVAHFFEDIYGGRVARYVRALTIKRRQRYGSHLAFVLKVSQEVGLIELANFYANNLRLDEVEDPVLRKSLSIKYLPVFDLFLPWIPSVDQVLLNDSVVQFLIRDLEAGRTFASYYSMTE